LLDFENGATGAILSKEIRACLAISPETRRRSLIRLRLNKLVAIGECLLPAFRILAASEGSHTRNLADLVVNLLNVGVTLQLLYSFQEGDLSHDDYFLKDHVDQTLFQVLIVVFNVLLDESHRLDQVDGIFLTLLDQLTEGLEQDLGARGNRLNIAILSNCLRCALFSTLWALAGLWSGRLLDCHTRILALGRLCVNTVYGLLLRLRCAVQRLALLLSIHASLLVDDHFLSLRFAKVESRALIPDHRQQGLVLHVDASVLVPDRIDELAGLLTGLDLVATHLAVALCAVQGVLDITRVVFVEPTDGSRLNPRARLRLHFLRVLQLHLFEAFKFVQAAHSHKFFRARDD